MKNILNQLLRDQSGWYGGEAGGLVYLLLVVIVVLVLLKVLVGLA